MPQDFYGWPDEQFEEMDSTLAVQQFIQQMVRRNPAAVDAILTAPEQQDEGVWKYEHLRLVGGASRSEPGRRHSRPTLSVFYPALLQ